MLCVFIGMRRVIYSSFYGMNFCKVNELQLAVFAEWCLLCMLSIAILVTFILKTLLNIFSQFLLL